MKTTVILGAMLLFVSTVEAGALIEGYGDVRFGDSLEEIRAVYPAIKKDNSGAWTCDVESPFFIFARARFLFNEQNALDYVQISGPLASEGLVGALVEKYGKPASVKEEWVAFAGNATSGFWSDTKGNRLWVQMYDESNSVSLRYMDAAKATAEDKKLAEKKRKQLEGL